VDTKRDRDACVERADGQEQAERRRKALMAGQSGHRLAEERRRHGPAQARLAEVMGVRPGRVAHIERDELAALEGVARTPKRTADGSTWSPASVITR
jgi:ribosome-binding protein aMBF1 (putative translation factor)